MDKIFDSNWALRITALILAIALFFYVQSLTNNNNETNTSIQSDIIENVPLEVYYDETNLIVTGLPETVDVKIEGSMQLVMQTKLLKDYKVFVDLNSLLIGEHSVPIQTENFSEKLKVTVDPSTVNIKIEERVTQEFRVEPEINNRQIAEGFVLASMEANPQRILISGAKSVIESISYVKASVKLEEQVSESFKQTASVIVLNRDLNKLDVLIEPQSVEVAVNIVPYTREIPIVLEEVGETDNVVIENVTLVNDTIELTGSKVLLDALREISAQLDLSQVNGAGQYEVSLTLPEGVKPITEDPILANVEVAEIEGVTEGE